MKRPTPIKVMWNGTAFVPSNRQLEYCRKEFGEGEIVTFERNEERSVASHSHQFAWLHEAFLNLPEHIARKHPSEDHLRKWALIETGFCHEDISVWETATDAMTAASIMKKLDTYCVVVVRGNIVRRYSAMSQSARAMGKKKFEDSKSAILELISNLIGVAPDQLKRERAA